MPLAGIAGALTRITLLVSLVAGGRVDCGTAGPDAAAARPANEPDCHHASGTGHDEPQTPAPNPHHGGGPAGGHCPAYHSCALDISLLAEGSEAGGPAVPPQPAPARGDRPTSRDQLPEVPPPRA